MISTMLSRAILRDSEGLQPPFAAASHPPAPHCGNRPDGTPRAQNCALPGEAVGFTISFQVHVSARLLAWAVALQPPLELIQFLSPRWQFRSRSPDLLLHEHSVRAVEREGILDLWKTKHMIRGRRKQDRRGGIRIRIDLGVVRTA